MHYSVITRCELFAGSYVDEPVARLLLAAMIELPITRSIAEAAGRLRRRTQIQVPDALIAATALEHSLELVTRNTRHFAQIPGLVVRSAV